MHRTMIMLPEEMHKNLKRMAVEQEVSLAEFIRSALLEQYREDLADLKMARKELARHRPGTGTPYEEFARKLRK